MTTKEEKKEALQNAIEEGNEYGYISWDGLLDLCDEDMVLGRYLIKELKKMKEANEIQFNISELV
jgi:transcription elongation factor GreA-like protein